MKIENFDVFKNDMFENLLKMDIDDVNVVCKCIFKLVSQLEKHDIEKVLMDKLFLLLEEKTDEVVEIVCFYLNITRNNDCYGFNNKLNRENTHKTNFECNERLDNGHTSVIQSESWTKKADNLKWSDIAVCAKNDGQRKINIPCGDLLEKGVCMKADSCRFTHRDCAVIKPRVSKFTSSYNTVADKVNYRSCILPGQSNYYDTMTVLPGAHSDDAISVSSAENSHNIDLTNQPCILEPPTLLDSPLWYQEMGLIEEDVYYESDSQRQTLHRRRSLIVSNIPKDLNRIDILNQHFRKFGVLRNIKVNYKNDPSRALVEFRLAKDMTIAAVSSDAVAGNRFIKMKPYKSKRKRKDGRHRRQRRRRSDSSTWSDDVYDNDSKKRRASSSYSRSRSRSRSRSHSRSRSCDSRRCRDYGAKAENHRRRRRREMSDYKKDRKKTLSREYDERKYHRDSRSEEIRNDEEDVSSSAVVLVEACVQVYDITESIPSRVVCKTEPEVEEVMEEEEEEKEAVVGGSCDNRQQEMEVVPEVGGGGEGSDRRTVIESVAIDNDLKLEQALNDSDVESVHSLDSFSCTTRRVVMDNRRKKLQDDRMKNNVKSKLGRCTESMQYYKSQLESLIVEYRRNDKPGKALLISRIKETHAKYMELKKEHEALCQSSAAKQLRQNDPIECQISSLGSTMEAALSVNHPAPSNLYIRVPSNIVLDRNQLQGHLGTNLTVLSMDRVPCPSTNDCCYILSFQAHSVAQAAMNFLASNNPMKWHMGLEAPADISI